MIRTALVAIMFLLMLRAAYLSPFGALLGYLWFALFRPQEWVWTDISQLRLSLVLGGILLFRCFTTNSWPDISHRLSRGTLLFLLTGLLSQLYAVNEAVGWQWLDFFSRLTLVSLLLVTLVNTRERFFYTIVMIASCLGFYTVKAGLASLLGGGVRYADGLAGSYSDNNGYAMAAVMIIPLLAAVAGNIRTTSTITKAFSWCFTAAVPLTVFAVISTFSRGGLVALVAVFLSYVVLQKKRMKPVAVLVLAAFVVLPFVSLPDGYQERMRTITSYEDVGESSALSRLHFWRVAWDMARENPLGVGMCNFQSAYDRYDFSDGQYGKGRAVHNSHLQVLTEEGFVGLFLWSMLFISAFRSCFRIRRLAKSARLPEQEREFFHGMALALTLSMIGFLAGGTFIALALNDLTWIIFGLVAALERLCLATVSVTESVEAAPALLSNPDLGGCLSVTRLDAHHSDLA